MVNKVLENIFSRCRPWLASWLECCTGRPPSQSVNTWVKESDGDELRQPSHRTPPVPDRTTSSHPGVTIVASGDEKEMLCQSVSHISLCEPEHCLSLSKVPSSWVIRSSIHPLPYTSIIFDLSSSIHHPSSIISSIHLSYQIEDKCSNFLVYLETNR